MNTEIFRFTATRPPQKADTAKATEITISLYNTNEETDFVRTLRDARQVGIEAMTTISNDFIKSVNYVKGASDLPAPYTAFDQYLLNNTTVEKKSAVTDAIQNIFQQDATTLITTPAFKETRQKLANSLLTSLIKKDVLAQEKNVQVRMLRITALIEKTVLTTGENINLPLLLSASFILPNNIFPLPEINSDLAEKVKKQKEEEEKERKEKEEERKKVIDEINATKAAFAEVEQSMQTEKLNLNASANPKSRITKKGFYLEAASANRLSESSKETVRRFNFDLQKIDTSVLLPKMENKLAELSEKLYRDITFSSKVHRIGNVFVADFPQVFDIGTRTPEKPGPCVTTLSPTTTNPAQSFVPDGKGQARVLGIMDLLLVEQKLLNYEKGEIAHIENVLIGETRERRHRRLLTREESVFTERESTDEKENDLTSTERYELQVESQKVINETLNYEAGVTANIYGISYDVSAHVNVAGSTSTSETNSSSSNFARDITTKAVNKITNRTLERRSVRTVEENEENNLHSFNNTLGTDHISGVYRWLDKIYEAQVVKYGKRLLLEFVIPEPAAFYRFALQRQPVENIMLTKPDEPGYCVGGKTFRPLRAKDITRENYLLWANKYNVSNITTPPPTYQVVGESFASEDSSRLQNKHGDNTFYYNAEKGKINIPTGYYPEKAKVNFDVVLIDNTGIGTAGSYNMTVQIEDTQISAKSANNTLYLSQFSTDTLPVSITSYNIVSYGLTITVFCKLAETKFEEWQLKTFTAVMEAYNDQKARYEEQLAADRISRGMGVITGRNPVFNRETEKTELKKNCITLLTGQRFELFNSMLRNVIYNNGQYGYPEIVSFDDAHAEGSYIQFFEQGIEWSNMLYVFYPYFWAEKSQWVQLSQLSDDDALFSKFLQAGSARVQVPVRPGFEFAITTYLQTGLLWQAEGDFIDANNDGIPDELQVSVLDELKEGILKSDESSGEPVGDPWKVRVPTSLVIIEKNTDTLIV